nr:hypothetical protein [Kineococcus siccus]
MDRPLSQASRHARTAAYAHRSSAPWTLEEDAELAACHDDQALEDFALRWSRGFRAVEQRRRRPRSTIKRTGNGWL